ncbi:cytosolic protein [Bacillaceae bacterium S4-13-58]
MSIKEFVNKYLSNHAETSDRSLQPELKTKYFKATKDQLFRHLIDQFSKSADYELIGSSEERGEISVYYKKKRKTFMVISVIMIRPYRTAVDFSVTTESAFPIDFGNTHRVIGEHYEWIGKTYPNIDSKEY